MLFDIRKALKKERKRANICKIKEKKEFKK